MRKALATGAITAFAVAAAAAVARGSRQRSEGVWNVTPALWAVRTGARCARTLLPLESRRRIVVALADRELPGQITIGIELLRDLAHDDPVGFHQFLWANHLAYASKYGQERLDSGSMEDDRRLLFDLIAEELHRQGSDSTTDVSSVLDAGCSSGFMLRAAETGVFPSATTLVGIDIDKRAIEMGRAHLDEADSRIELIEARMEDVESLLDGRRFDVTTCCGSLMYLDEERAAQTVAGLVRISDRVVGLMARAHPDFDNRYLDESEVRPIDETWIHNVDLMVEAAGGRVVSRHWQPPAHMQDRGLYLILAVPGARNDAGAASARAV